MQKITMFLFSAFFCVAVSSIASASTTQELQPASNIVYNEELTVNNTVKAYSLRVGSQGFGGVTFFNGTIVNETVDTETGEEQPVTFGDDVRIDGRVWRGATSGPEADGSTPFVINDNLEVLGTIQGSDIIGVNQLAISNTGSSGQILSLNSSGALEWTDDATGGSSGSSGDITGVTAGSGLTGGGTSGAVTLSVSGVTSSMITNGTIATADIADSAITSAKIQNGTIANSDVSATAEISPSKISGTAWTSSNDGAGSTLDADLLDNTEADALVHTEGDIMSGALIISGASSGSQMLNVTNTADSSNAIVGTASGTGNNTAGVNGLATGLTGKSYGGYFQSKSDTGYGVYGIASASGINYGGYFITASATGYSGSFNGGNFEVNLGLNSNFIIDPNGGGVSINAAGSPAASGQALDVEGLIGLLKTDVPGTCDATSEGAIYYGESLGQPCFCNGISWKPFDGGVGNCTP